MSTFKYPFQSKLPTVPTSIFAVMSQLAAKENALNLSQGFPDFKSDKKLIELVNKAMVSGKNQYAPMPGIFSLREAIAEKTENLYGVSYNLDTEITITAGATQAIFTVIAATIQKGDEVIIFKPAYDCYEPTIELFGGKSIAVQLNPEEFSINWQEVKKMITEKTKMLIINSPHNPSGRVLSKNDMLQLETLLKNTNILLLSDEVYEHMVYDNQRHISLLENDLIRTRSFVISSFGKAVHATGWKVAYCIAPQEMTNEFRKIHQFVTYTTHTPTQWALAEFWEKHKEHLVYFSGFYQKKRNLFVNALKESQFKLVPTSGTYFQLANYSQISDMTDIEFANYLTQEVGVAAIPISVFSEVQTGAKFVRFCFAKNDETLLKACERLGTL